MLKLPWKKRKILRLGFTLVEIMHTKTFWVVFTTLCRECRCWPRSLSSPSSRSALGRNALVSLRGEHQSHTTSFLHFLLQYERALYEMHKKFLLSDCKCFRSHGVFYWGRLAYGREILSAAACTDGGAGHFIVNVSGWRYGSEKMVAAHKALKMCAQFKNTCKCNSYMQYTFSMTACF